MVRKSGAKWGLPERGKIGASYETLFRLLPDDVERRLLVWYSFQAVLPQPSSAAANSRNALET